MIVVARHDSGLFVLTDQQALIRAFADFARTLSRPYHIGDVLYRLTDQVVEVLAVDRGGRVRR